MNPITSEVFRKIAEKFWGSAEAADASSYEGKALAAMKLQNRNCIEDSLGLCDYAWPIAYSLSGRGDKGTKTGRSRFYNHAVCDGTLFYA